MASAIDQHPLLTGLAKGLSPTGVGSGRVLVGVSGGPDSVALLRGLLVVAERQPLELFVAHFDHGWRPESRDDARWVEDLCCRWSVPCFTGEARRGGEGAIAAESEEAARNSRYAFLRETAQSVEAKFIAVAHTADDQAETVLHHIVRGTGLAGLAGMPRRRRLEDGIELVRPLLDVPRDVVHDYLQHIGQDFRRDATNDDRSRTRSRLRHDLLPLLRSEFNPQVDSALLRLAAQAAEAREAIEGWARQALDEALLDRSEHVCRLRQPLLAALPRQVQREARRLLWREQNWPRQQMGQHESARQTDLIAAERPPFTLPGNITATRRGELIVLTRA
ncbi:MAG: tRNA lysidine(34) synthetase TilS [Planctomycetes bacterium]|nr:tRNA lysidine(34) synthetase TilS [Planctomycetota bacterium]